MHFVCTNHHDDFAPCLGSDGVQAGPGSSLLCVLRHVYGLPCRSLYVRRFFYRIPLLPRYPCARRVRVALSGDALLCPRDGATRLVEVNPLLKYDETITLNPAD